METGAYIGVMISRLIVGIIGDVLICMYKSERQQQRPCVMVTFSRGPLFKAPAFGWRNLHCNLSSIVICLCQVVAVPYNASPSPI